jgi:hypothetical protein
MNRKQMVTMMLVFIFATAAAISATSATATPTSLGACNMLHTSPKGMDGMLKAAQGLDNMMQLVIASEAAGCSL